MSEQSVQLYWDPNRGDHFYWSPQERCYAYRSDGQRFNFDANGVPQRITRPVQPAGGSQQPRVVPRPPTAEQVRTNTNPGQAAQVGSYEDNTYAPVPGRAPTTRSQRSSSNDRRFIRGTAGNHEQLDSRYRKRGSNEGFFTFGRVFKVSWFEPNGNTDEDNGTVVTENFGQKPYSKIRWFVVIRENRDHCQCLPIQTYGGRGVSKPGVEKGEHAIIHTGSTAPSQMKSELPGRGEEPMRSPIRVVPTVPTDKLDPISRIHFGRVYTVEHNVKVMDVGEIHKLHIQKLIDHFQQTFLQPISSGVSTAGAGGRNAQIQGQGPSNDLARAYAGQGQQQTATSIQGHSVAVQYAQAMQGTQPPTSGGTLRQAVYHSGDESGEGSDDDSDDDSEGEHSDTGYTHH